MIEMKICTSVELGNVIMDVKFKFEKFQGFDVIGYQNSLSSNDFARGQSRGVFTTVQRYCVACDVL